MTQREHGETLLHGTVALGHVPEAALTRVVDLARLAPSIHNTQPWSWVLGDGWLELWADHSRALLASDPRERNLTISCGAALHHSLVAARALGLEPRPERVPDPTEPDLLARLTFLPGTPAVDAARDLAAIRERVTDRRRFTRWPVHDDRVRRLAASASTTRTGPEAVALTRAPLRERIEWLVEVARAKELQDALVQSETDLWIDHGRDDGIPRAVLPELRGEPGEFRTRFTRATDWAGEGATQGTESVLSASDGLVLIATDRDDVASWLSAGEALSALWLRATTEGLSVVPLSQAVEDEPTRHALRSALPGHRPEPQILVRIGWQEIGRRALPRTPRRPLSSVLRLRS